MTDDLNSDHLDEDNLTPEQVAAMEVDRGSNIFVRRDLATRFQKGNKAWLARSTHGRKPIFSNAEDLQDACEQYFEWNADNPLIEFKPNTNGDNYIPRMRAMTLTSLRRFIGISADTWILYKEKPDFAEVIAEAEEIVRDQKLEGAAAGFLNANIIARDLGLRDGIDSKVTAEVDLKKLPTDQLFQLYLRLKKDMNEG